MPNRIIRENILTSVPMATLGWPEEVFYRRVMSIVDDYGRYEALPQLLRSRCYPLQTDQVRVADITRWMAACQKAGLVVLYEVAGKTYLQIEKFGQQQRTPSKFPAPPQTAIICDQKIAAAPVFVSVVADGGVTPKPPKGADALFEKFWSAYPSKVAKDAARKAFAKRDPDAELVARMLAAIEAQRASVRWTKDGGQYIPNPATWLNGGCWQDGIEGDGEQSVDAWHETKGGVERRAAALGLPAWDGVEPWGGYKARVLTAAKEAA